MKVIVDEILLCDECLLMLYLTNSPEGFVHMHPPTPSCKHSGKRFQRRVVELTEAEF